MLALAPTYLATSLTFACTVEASREAVKAAVQFLRQNGVSAQELGQWELLLTEASVNAVRHSTLSQASFDNELLVVIRPTEIEVHVEDHTCGFELPPCLQLPEPLSEDGRGLFVLRALVDHVDYFRGRISNRLRVLKNRIPVEPTLDETGPADSVPEDRVASLILEHDLQTARSIQQALLPRQLPQVPGFTFAGQCISAREVGGDFFDIIKWDEHSLLCVVADVMGKGMSAALLAGMLRSHLHALQEWAIRPGDFLAKINQRLYPDLAHLEMFITVQLVFVDLKRRTLRLASAGHGPLLIADPKAGSVVELNAEGMPLGILPEQSYPQVEASWNEGGGFLMYTDGVTEGRGQSREFFSLERLKSWFAGASRSSQTAEELAQDLSSVLASFQGPTPLRDDQTFLLHRELTPSTSPSVGL